VAKLTATEKHNAALESALELSQEHHLISLGLIQRLLGENEKIRAQLRAVPKVYYDFVTSCDKATLEHKFLRKEVVHSHFHGLETKEFSEEHLRSLQSPHLSWKLAELGQDLNPRVRDIDMSASSFCNLAAKNAQRKMEGLPDWLTAELPSSQVDFKVISEDCFTTFFDTERRVREEFIKGTQGSGPKVPGIDPAVLRQTYAECTQLWGQASTGKMPKRPREVSSVVDDSAPAPSNKRSQLERANKDREEADRKTEEFTASVLAIERTPLEKDDSVPVMEYLSIEFPEPHLSASLAQPVGEKREDDNVRTYLASDNTPAKLWDELKQDGYFQRATDRVYDQLTLAIEPGEVEPLMKMPSLENVEALDRTQHDYGWKFIGSPHTWTIEYPSHEVVNENYFSNCILEEISDEAFQDLCANGKKPPKLNKCALVYNHRTQRIEWNPLGGYGYDYQILVNYEPGAYNLYEW